ncbi:hypothetical protein FQA39_LY16490 [Lamprigera yunnana]|nr:hypothetical protein FQA39_LY16490 [Lamprigera yunnana]
MADERVMEQGEYGVEDYENSIMQRFDYGNVGNPKEDGAQSQRTSGDNSRDNMAMIWSHMDRMNYLTEDSDLSDVLYSSPERNVCDFKYLKLPYIRENGFQWNNL